MLKEVNLRLRDGLTALAIYRNGQSICDKFGRIRLRVGDVLLLHGQSEWLQNLRRKPDLAVLEELTPPEARRKRGICTPMIFGAAILLCCMTSFGMAVEKTGAAVFLAGYVIV